MLGKLLDICVGWFACSTDYLLFILQGPICGHVGDGNFHALLIIDPSNDEQIQEAKDLANRMAE